MGMLIRWRLFMSSLDSIKFNINNLILAFGLMFQSYLLLESRGDAVIMWGFWAWMSIPYWILFFANLHSNRTLPARIIVTLTIFVVVILGNIIYSLCALNKDALNGLVYLFLPALSIVISSLVFIVALFLNRRSD